MTSTDHHEASPSDLPAEEDAPPLQAPPEATEADDNETREEEEQRPASRKAQDGSHAGRHDADDERRKQEIRAHVEILAEWLDHELAGFEMYPGF